MQSTATSVNWVNSEILKHQYDEQPVSVVLEVTVVHHANRNQSRAVVRRIVLQALDAMACQLTGEHAPFDKTCLVFYRNPSVKAPPKHYLSRCGHSDIVKTITIRQFFDKFNRQHMHLGVEISWLLTKPIDFFGIRALVQNQTDVNPDCASLMQLV